MALFLAVLQIEAVCAFPRYIPPLSARQPSCSERQGEKPAACSPRERLVVLLPGRESTKGMLKRTGQGVLKR